MERVLITGAGRGIGLELARHYAERGDHVLAGYRDLHRAPALQQLAAQHGDRLTMLALDVADPQSLEAAYHTAEQKVEGLDLLINNAAINPGDRAALHVDSVFDSALVLDVLRVNSVAPLIVAQRFLNLLRKGSNPRIVNISSGAGSLAGRTATGEYVYAASKSALNMFTRALAFNVVDDGIIVVAMDPGWVRTDMGGPDAHLAPEQSAQGQLAVIDRLSPQDAGRFLSWDGSEVPW